MRCLHVALFGLLFLVIIGILVVIWYFEGPDSGGYDQVKEPVVDRGISAFLGAYLPLILLPFLLFFVLFICYLRLRAQKRSGKGEVHNSGMPAAPATSPPIVSIDVSEQPPPMVTAAVRGDGAPAPLPLHSSRPIPPLPEFHDAPAIPSRQRHRK